MKGLMIKDLQLMKAQKSFFILVFILGITLLAVTGDESFIGGYLALIISTFVVSTISYDEHDNGNVFMFSLPITRKEYVKEKYLFGLLGGTVVWGISIVFSIAHKIVNASGFSLGESFRTLTCNILLVCFILAFMLPIQLKFGTEKGRLITSAMIGIATGIAVVGTVCIEHMIYTLERTINEFQKMPASLLTLGTLVVSLVMLSISYKISVRVMEKREF